MTKKCIACDIYCLFAQGRYKKYNRVMHYYCVFNEHELKSTNIHQQHELLSSFLPLKPGLLLNKNSMLMRRCPLLPSNLKDVVRVNCHHPSIVVCGRLCS